jgi:hypothetical protein
MTDKQDSISPKRLAAVALLRRGVATLADVAWLTGASRQLIRHWARQAEIDATKRRAAYLERHWSRQMRRQGARRR